MLSDMIPRVIIISRKANLVNVKGAWGSEGALSHLEKGTRGGGVRG